jgi:hypothetical protein
VDRRRVELELRLVRGLLHAELRRSRPGLSAGFAERSGAILDRLALAIDAEADPDLVELLAAARAEVSELAARS